MVNSPWHNFNVNLNEHCMWALDSTILDSIKTAYIFNVDLVFSDFVYELTSSHTEKGEAASVYNINIE